jgi:tripartite-type tricarboxylate transporter receptor subunit TctC
MPPNTPAEQAKVIREAFEKTLNDPAAVAEATKKKLEFDPTGADELASLAKEVTSQSPEAVARMKKLLAK